MIMPKEYWDSAEVHYVYKLLSRSGEATAIPLDVIGEVLEVGVGEALFPDAIIEGGDPDEEASALSMTTEAYLKGKALIADDRMEQVRQLLQAYEEAVQRGESPVLPVIGEAETEIMQEVADQTTQPVSVVWRIYGAHLEWNALTAYGDEIGGKS